jgi:hypothetical protein
MAGDHPRAIRSDDAAQLGGEPNSPRLAWLTLRQIIFKKLCHILFKTITVLRGSDSAQ